MKIQPAHNLRVCTIKCRDLQATKHADRTRLDLSTDSSAKDFGSLIVTWGRKTASNFSSFCRHNHTGNALMPMIASYSADLRDEATHGSPAWPN
jgi:hypothetical protein